MLYQEPGLDFDIFSAVDSKAEGGSAEGAAQEPETDEQRNERYKSFSLVFFFQFRKARTPSVSIAMNGTSNR